MAPPREHAALLRTRRPLVALVLAAFVLGIGGGNVAAQEEPAGPIGEDLFGGYDLSGRGNGVQITYDTPGTFPLPSPVFQATVPEAIATLNGGPSAAALASVAYPGPVVANLGALIDVASGQQSGIPQYPIAARAFHPSGPPEDVQVQPDGTTMAARTSAISANAFASYSGTKAPPAMEFGSLVAGGDSSVVDKKAVARSRAVASDIRILDGLFTIDSVVTDLVASTDGTAGATAGGTTVSGFRFLGLDVVVDRDGMRLAEAPAEGPAPPVLGPLGQPLAPVTDALAGLANEIRTQKAGILDDLLAQAGMSVRLLDPIEVVDGSSANRTANGLVFSFTYVGQEQAQMNQLVGMIPPELRGSIGGQIPNPVNFLVETHIGGFAIAPASVTSVTSPAFLAEDFPLDVGLGDDLLGTDLGTSGFDTPVPALGGETAASDGAAAGDTPIEGDAIASGLGTALPAALVVLLVVASPFFAMGSSRLADNVLDVVETSCPLGLEKPPPPPPET